ncbi:MAG TPA: TonB family protein [Polyangia bacterium]
MNFRKTISWMALLGTSLGLHAVGFARLNGMGARMVPKVASKPAFMEMTAAPKPSAPAPEPPLTTEKPAPRAIRKVAAVAPRSAPRAESPARAAAAPPAAETPADFSGTTLTNDSVGAGWASATGDGAAMGGPVGRPGARVTGRHVEGTSQVTRPAPAPVVPVADLSRLPEAPRLEDALERNYPAEARQSGLAGKAVVRARITPEGSVRDLLVVSETAAGFGRACRDTLTGSRWTPPLDRDGHAVATVINYTCRFEVR